MSFENTNVEAVTTQCDDSWRSVFSEVIMVKCDHKDENLIRSTEVLRRRGRERPGEDIARGGYLQARKRVLTRNQICQHLTLGFQTSATVKNKYL